MRPELTVSLLFPNGEPTRMSDVKRARRRLFLWVFDSECFHCGSNLTMDSITIDHLFPKARGGSKTWENIVPSCAVCNNLKADSTPSKEDLERASEHWRRFNNPTIQAMIFAPNGLPCALKVKKVSRAYRSAISSSN